MNDTPKMLTTEQRAERLTQIMQFGDSALFTEKGIQFLLTSIQDMPIISEGIKDRLTGAGFSHLYELFHVAPRALQNNIEGLGRAAEQKIDQAIKSCAAPIGLPYVGLGEKAIFDVILEAVGLGTYKGNRLAQYGDRRPRGEMEDRMMPAVFKRLSEGDIRHLPETPSYDFIEVNAEAPPSKVSLIEGENKVSDGVIVLLSDKGLRDSFLALLDKVCKQNEFPKDSYQLQNFSRNNETEYRIAVSDELLDAAANANEKLVRVSTGISR